MDFVGVIGHQLFGFSTDAELQQLQKNIESILSGSSDVTKTLNSQITNLFSSLKVTNERIDSAMKNEKTLFDKFGSFARVMNKTLGTIYLNWITAFESIHSAVLIHLDLTDYHAALVRLALGKLDPRIISPDDLKIAELEIDKTLKIKYPGYSVIKQNTAIQYSQHDCVAIRHNRTVFITKQFPITSWHQKFRLYQIRTLQHPVTENESHITAIENLPKYVMISEDTKYLLEFDDTPNTKHKIYHIGKSTIKNSQQNCAVALLQSDNTKIRKLCRMTMIRDAVQPEIVRINSDHMLLVDIQQYTLVCPNENENKVIKGCKFRIKQFGCGCIVKTIGVTLPSQITDCSKQIDKSTELHPINLNYLGKFFSYDHLKDVNGSKLFGKDIKIELPEIEIFEDTKIKPQHIEYDQKLKLDLTKLADKFKNDQTIYESSDSEFRHRIEILTQFADFSIRSWRDLTIVATGVITFLNIIALVYIIYRLKYLAIAVAFTPTTQALNSSLYLVYQTKKIGPDTSDIKGTSLGLQDITVHLQKHVSVFNAVLLISIIVLLLLIIQNRRSKLQRWGTTICFNFANDNGIVSLPWQTLPDTVDKFQFSSKNFISKVSITGFPIPKIQLSWKLRIKHAHVTQPMSLRKSKYIDWLQYWRLQKIIKRTFLVIPFLRQGDGMLIDMNIDSMFKVTCINQPQEISVFQEDIELDEVVVPTDSDDLNGN